VLGAADREAGRVRPRRREAALEPAQLTFLALSKSPMFLPVATASGLAEVWLASEQSSKAGSGSP
jgi:hypothetical protein